MVNTGRGDTRVDKLITDRLWQPGPPFEYNCHPEQLPSVELQEKSYLLRYARNQQDLNKILQLRFDIFNLELGEGLDESFQTGRDQDEFDLRFHHLMVVHTDTREVVGTYRMQTFEMARESGKYYTGQEFDLSAVPDPIMRDSIEIGRACVARNHRNFRVLQLLWRGLATYAMYNRKRYFFGCTSLTSQDPLEGLAVLDYLEKNGYINKELPVEPKPGFECNCDERLLSRGVKMQIPKLLKTYLHIGAKICGRPAIDREFKTIDFFTLIDTLNMEPRTRRALFGQENAS